MPISIIDDGTTSNENRLGAIRDIKLAIDEKFIKDDIIVLAGDNMYDFSLLGFVEFYNQKRNNCIMIHEEKDVNKLKKTGVAEISDDNIVISFEEKPIAPKSYYAVPPFYIYTKDSINLFDQYLTCGNNPDAPGNFITWLCRIKDVYAYKMPGKRYDIGDINSYEVAKKVFEISSKMDFNSIYQ